MERTGRTRPRTARLVVTPSTVVLIFGSVAAVVLLLNVFVAARRPLGWAVAALVTAAAIEPAVSLVSRRMRRGMALIVVLLPLLAGVGLVVRGVYEDLDRSTSRLQEAIPEAATNLEESERFGQLARDLDLRTRAEEAAARLEKPSAGVADEAVGSGSAWLICTVLTIFALAWGPRFAQGALRQVDDPERRDRLARVVGVAFERSQTYLDLALFQAVLVGSLSWLVFRAFEVPAPTPLAVLVAVLSMVPVVGIFVGSLPAVMLVAGFETYGRALLLLAIMLVAQVAQVALFREITRRTLYVGPGLMVIAFLIGSDVYGLGGAVFGTAIAVFGIALADAAAEEAGPRHLRPQDADPTESPTGPRPGSAAAAEAEADAVAAAEAAAIAAASAVTPPAPG